MNNNTAPRLANIELLRIIAMLSVIGLHFLGVGGILEYSVGVHFYIASALYAVLIVATNIYVIISGYFSINSTFRLSRIYKILLEFFTYSIGIYIVACIVTKIADGTSIFSVKDLLLTYLFPVIHEENWFVTSFVLVMIFSPFYNILIKALNRHQLRVLIAFLLLTFSIIPTFFHFASTQLGQFSGYTFVWFTVLYFFAAYIRICGVPKAWTALKLCILWLVTTLITYGLAALEFAKPSILTEEKNSYYFFFSYNSFFVFLASCAVFALFLRIKITNEKAVTIINKIASYSFAVFLIHTHPAIADRLWYYWVGTSNIVGTWKVIPAFIICSIAIYAVCSLIEQLRLWIFRPLIESETIAAKLSEWDKKLGI